MEKFKDFINELENFDDVISSMKHIGENYISSKQIEARLLADWMFRFATKIEELKNKI